MHRSDEEKGKGKETAEKAEPARLERTRHVRRIRRHTAGAAGPMDAEEQAPIPPTAVAIVDGRLEK